MEGRWDKDPMFGGLSGRRDWELDMEKDRFTRSDGLGALMGLEMEVESMTFGSMERWVHPQDRVSMQRLFHPSIEDGPIVIGEFRLIWPDASIHWVRIVGFPILNGGPGPKSLIGIAEDISDQKDAELKVAQLRASLDRSEVERKNIVEEAQNLVYHISHDLQAPLRSVNGFGQALLEGHSDGLDAKGKDYLVRIISEADRMNMMMAGLLQYYRISTRPIEVREVDLSNIARNNVNRARSNYPRAEIDFQISDGVTSRGDADLLDIAMGCLIDNACKFSVIRSDPQVVFGSSDEGDGGTYFVRDNGVGFDPAYSGKLFTPFQRLHYKNEFPGIGMGLAIAALIVRRHGGRIWAVSEVDRGATFFFRLS